MSTPATCPVIGGATGPLILPRQKKSGVIPGVRVMCGGLTDLTAVKSSQAEPVPSQAKSSRGPGLACLACQEPWWRCTAILNSLEAISDPCQNAGAVEVPAKVHVPAVRAGSLEGVQKCCEMKLGTNTFGTAKAPHKPSLASLTSQAKPILTPGLAYEETWAQHKPRRIDGFEGV